MSARTVLATTTAGLLVAAGAGGYMFWDQNHQEQVANDAADNAALSFAQAWAARHLDRATYVGTTGSAAQANFDTATAALGKGTIRTSVESVKRSGDTAAASIKVSWAIGGGQTFTWSDPVNLAKAGNTWGVKIGDASLWHPKLQANDRFVLKADTGLRGQVLGKGNAGIMTNQTVYDISLDPTKATPATAATVAAVTGSSELVTKLAKAKAKGSKATIFVVTYRQADYESRAAAFRADGVVVAQRKQPLAASKTFAQPILGSVGPVTAEMVTKNPQLYRAGMFAGASGLQRQYDTLMQPKGGLLITAASAPGTSLFGAPATNGSNLVTTLDPVVQTAAESALAKLGSDKSAAIVAIDVPSGNIIAAANGPTFGLERALTGRYSPGSTFKISTAYQLMRKGLDPNSVVTCPQELNVDGSIIRNFEGESLGSPTFVDDFAHSCNTAFTASVMKYFGTSDSKTGAAAFGIGGSWGDQVGYSGAYTGSVPVASGKTDQAAMSFGQGRIQVSPLAVAAMAGSVARGSFLPPTLVTSPAPAGSRAPMALDAPTIASLKTMMRKTVTDGTATLLSNTPGGDVYAKTGTAEFSEGGKSGAHAWLAGWQGNVAFAVLVADVPAGQGGGTVAAPVARDFLTTLANTPH
ncbi:penicillin-binding transpeptidase domain-containing protein [Calidifontibacter terrae]